MVPTQRKRHLVVWVTLAILLPILVFWAFSVIPQTATQDKLYQEPAPTIQSNQ